jgi:hypothetical protein
VLPWVFVGPILGLFAVYLVLLQAAVKSRAGRWSTDGSTYYGGSYGGGVDGSSYGAGGIGFSAGHYGGAGGCGGGHHGGGGFC